MVNHQFLVLGITKEAFKVAKILFISDIHYSVNDKNDVYTDDSTIKFPHLIGTQGLRVIRESIKNIAPIDLVVFCGDFIKGCDSDEEKEAAIEEIKKLVKDIVEDDTVFGEKINPKERIIFVLGNHDMDRDSGNYHSGITELIAPYLSTETGAYSTQPNAPIFVFDELKIVLAAIPTERNSNVKNKSIQKAIKIISDSKADTCDKEQIINLLKPYNAYDIPSIDTETSDYFMEISNKMKKSTEDYYHIMVTHHPLLDGIENGAVVKKYGNTVGGYDLMQKAKAKGYSLFVHGHLHEKSCVEVIDHLSENKSSIIQLGLPRTKIDTDGCGCVLVDIDVDNKSVSCTLLKPDSTSWRFKQTPLLNISPQPIESNSGNKILVDYEIAEIIKNNVIIKNGDISNVEAASYDCALGYEYKRRSNSTSWTESDLQRIEPKKDGPSGISLKPNETILIFSYEEFDIPNDMVMHASPISNWLRKGVKFDISYFVDPGFKGKFCIPATNESEEEVYLDAQKPFISLELIKLSNPCKKGWKEKHPDLCAAREHLDE